MIIVIPLGGIGKRFSEMGYTDPKPLIKVLGKEIIFYIKTKIKKLFKKTFKFSWKMITINNLFNLKKN